MREDGLAILDAGATANLVCFRWLENHNLLPAQRGFPQFSTFPAKARFEFRGSRMGEVRCAAEITVGVAGNKGSFTASVLDADLPAYLRKGADGFWRTDGFSS